MGLLRRLRYALQDRWIGLIFGMWMQSCGGISYAFSLYSTSIKSQLAYNQETIDGLGTAKDIGGNVGIVSGLLIDIMPAWSILLIGAIMHLCGYTMLYLASMGYLRPPFWQMCIIIMLGTNGATWFNTAVLVTCIRNFQGDRGVVVGLLKGFIGLSGAIFTQVYTAVYAPDTAPFLLLCALVPPTVALLSMVVIRPIETAVVPADSNGGKSEDADKRRFRFLYVVGVGLALYLMASIILQEAIHPSKFVSKLLMGFMLIILMLPAIIPWNISSASSLRRGSSVSSLLPSSSSSSSLPLLNSDEDASSSASPHKISPSSLSQSTSAGDSVRSSENGSDKTKEGPPEEGSGRVFHQHQRGATPRLGANHPLFQAAMTPDYWLLFFAMGCGTGSGLTAINNLGQMAEALGSKSVGAFVALVSVWNFLGRMGAGYISEHYVKRHGACRPLFMLAVQLAMGVAHLLFASSVPFLLYVGSALVGLAHGAHWTLMVAISSELFGLRHFGALYNTLSISATIGSYCLSVKLAGYIYDQQVAAERAAALAQGLTLEEGHKCIGPQCFRPTFIVMALTCCVGALALLKLVSRTRKLYQDMHKVQTS